MLIIKPLNTVCSHFFSHSGKFGTLLNYRKTLLTLNQQTRPLGP